MPPTAFVAALHAAVFTWAQAAPLVPSPSAAARAGPQTAPCDQLANASLICQDGPEDLALVPGNRWVIASSILGSGGLFAVSVADRKSRLIYPERGTHKRLPRPAWSGCPGPPSATDRAKFYTGGLALGPTRGGISTLYAVHHGGRESIEVFRLDTRGDSPTVQWLGCVLAPAGLYLNSVAPLPTGGFVATNFRTGGTFGIRTPPDADPNQSTGEAWRWSRKRGWSKIHGTEAAGPNGVVVSADGKWMYMCAFINRSIIRFSLDTRRPRRSVIPLGFRADNVRTGPAGKLFVAGQAGGKTFAVSIDPDTLKVTPLIARAEDAVFAFGTTALPVGDELWIASPVAFRIGVFPLPDTP